MKVTIQLTSENRIHFSSFDNGEMKVSEICKSLVLGFGDCKPYVVHKEGLSEDEEEQLKEFMIDLITVYKSGCVQLPLF